MAWRAVFSFVGSSLDLGMSCLEGGRGMGSVVVAEGAIAACIYGRMLRGKIGWERNIRTSV